MPLELNPGSRANGAAVEARWSVLCSAGLLVAALAIFGGGLSSYFVDDDFEVIFNPGHWIRPWAGGQFRPILGLLLRAVYGAWGFRPEGFHIVSLAGHVLAALALCALVRDLGGRRGLGFLVAAAFLIYPRQHEAVLRLAMNIPLATLFALLSALGFRIFLRTGRRVALAGSAGAYALALLSYEVAIILPGLLLAMEWLFGLARGKGAGRGLKYLPFAAIALGFVAVTFSGEAAQRLSTTGAGYHFSGLNLKALKGLFFYLSYTLFPWITVGMEAPQWK